MKRTSAAILVTLIGALPACGEKQPPAAQPAASASAAASAPPAASTARPWYLPTVKEDGGVSDYIAASDAGAGPSKWAFSVEPTEKWDCPFPPQKERAGLMEATVFIRVSVDENGKPTDAEILEEPKGSGFGKSAKKCALAKAYTPARDANGKPFKSTTYPFYLRYLDKPPSAPGMPASK